uniref:Uncharacterized protein n=1 Tax=Setaria digitata TaxID=48799 RepID=A0A915PFG3_9BILA
MSGTTRLLTLFFCISTTSAQIALPEQIPYWVGGAAISSLLGNRLLGTDQQLGSLGLRGIGLGSLGGLGGNGMTGFGGLGSLGGLGLNSLGVDGLQIIQIPLGNAFNNNMPSSCTSCVVCAPQSTSANCIPMAKPTPFNGQFCCCCTSGIGSTVGAFNGR